MTLHGRRRSGRGDVTDSWVLGDGIVTIRPPRPGESALIVAGRDEEWARWLGPGAPEPTPTACILVDKTLVGWVDYDVDQEWLAQGEVNVGYSVFAAYRGQGYATRAVLLLLERLAVEGRYHTATLTIARGNVASLRVAALAGFELVGESTEGLRFARSVGLGRGES